MEKMMRKAIKMTQDQVADFVRVASKSDFGIDISYNRYIVDAKSFLGVYGMDLTKVLTVTYDGYNPEFESILNQMAVAC